MLGRPSDTPARRRGGAARALAVVTSTALLATGLALAGTASAEAAGKHATSVSLRSITDASTTGSFTISGDDLTLRGTTSANLVGKTLRVQVRKGTRWVAISPTAVVSATRTFEVVTRASGAGTQTYRVGYAGSRTLKPSTGSRAVTVWKWFPLTDQPVVSKSAPAGSTAPHAAGALIVAGTGYPGVLAGSATASGTASSDFVLGDRCATFTSVVGLANGSAAGSTATFSVSLDGSEATKRPDLAVGATSSFAIALTGNERIRLQATTVVPAGGQAIAAWPLAQVLCSARP